MPEAFRQGASSMCICRAAIKMQVAISIWNKEPKKKLFFNNIASSETKKIQQKVKNSTIFRKLKKKYIFLEKKFHFRLFKKWVNLNFLKVF